MIMWARVSAVIRMTRMLNTITQHHPLPPLLFLVLQTQLVITVIATLALLIIQVRDCLHITIQTVVFPSTGTSGNHSHSVSVSASTSTTTSIGNQGSTEVRMYNRGVSYFIRF